MENEFDIHFQKEGNTWTATLKGKTPSIAGFGESPEEALTDLFLESNKDNYQQEIRESK